MRKYRKEKVIRSDERICDIDYHRGGEYFADVPIKRVVYIGKALARNKEKYA